jgi:hypothetical protein
MMWWTSAAARLQPGTRHSPAERLVADRLNAIRPERRRSERVLLEVHHLFHYRPVLGRNLRHENPPALVLTLLESGLPDSLVEITNRAGACALDPKRLVCTVRERQHGFRLATRDVSRPHGSA